MADTPKLHRPRLVAVWPGMGGVAVNAGYYLLAKLHMRLIAEYHAGDLFDVDHVEVKDGLIAPGRWPRNRFFAWADPRRQHDLVVFLGEAQPPLGKYQFCRALIEFARGLGVERVYTFAAMATQMHPEHASRVFAAATDPATLAELRRLELTLVQDGHIAGLNGVLLGAAAEAGLPGACLLGEMPHIFAEVPFPQASLAILEVFATMTGVTVGLAELAEQARVVQEQLGDLLGQVEQAYGPDAAEPAEGLAAEPADEPGRLTPLARHRLDELFTQARRDRSKAFELKQELDRLGVFKEYEDRFLDLFKQPGAG